MGVPPDHPFWWFLMGFSIINHPFGGTPIYEHPHICLFFRHNEEVLHSAAQVSRFHEHDDLFLEMMQLQSKGFIKIHYDLVVVGNLEKLFQWWTQTSISTIGTWFFFRALPRGRPKRREAESCVWAAIFGRFAPQFHRVQLFNGKPHQPKSTRDSIGCFILRWCNVKAGRISSGHCQKTSWSEIFVIIVL